MKLIWFGTANYDWEVIVKVKSHLQQQKCAHTHAYVRSHAHARTHARTHAHTHTLTLTLTLTHIHKHTSEGKHTHRHTPTHLTHGNGEVLTDDEVFINGTWQSSFLYINYLLLLQLQHLPILYIIILLSLLLQIQSLLCKACGGGASDIQRPFCEVGSLVLFSRVPGM